MNWREPARSGEWAQHFSNASCYEVCNIVKNWETDYEIGWVGLYFIFFIFLAQIARSTVLDATVPADALT